MNECCKKKHREEDEYKKLINRLSRIEGQIRGIKKMVETDSYCVDILTQAAAADSAIKAFSRELLDNHIRTCVADGIKAGDDEIISELMTTLKKFM